MYGISSHKIIAGQYWSTLTEPETIPLLKFSLKITFLSVHSGYHALNY